MSEPLTWKPGPPPLDHFHVGWLIDRSFNRQTITPYKIAYNEDVGGPALYWMENNRWLWWGTAFHDLVAMHFPCPWPIPIPAPPSGDQT